MLLTTLRELREPGFSVPAPLVVLSCNSHLPANWPAELAGSPCAVHSRRFRAFHPEYIGSSGHISASAVGIAVYSLNGDLKLTKCSSCISPHAT